MFGPSHRLPHPGRTRARQLTGSLVLLTSCLVVTAAAAARFSVTPIVGPNNRPCIPLAISSNGSVAGAIQVGGGSLYHPFVWSGSGVLELPTLASPEAQATTDGYATGVNASGHVVGYSQIATDGPVHAFIFKDNVLTDLSEVLGNVSSQANAINDAGTLVGRFGDFGQERAFVLRSDNALIDLGPGEARAISESGYVVGETSNGADVVPFLFRDANGNGQVDAGEYVTLGTPNGGSNNMAQAVNNSGVVVGAVEGQDDLFHAAIWQGAQGSAPQQGTMPQLINSDPTHSIARGINNAGSIVGVIGGGAFLWENGNWVNLDSLVPTAGNTPNPSWHVFTAAAINNAGQIAGDGIPAGTATVTGCRLSAGSQPPAQTVQLKDLTITPAQFTLRNAMTYVDVTLTLTAKPKGAISIPIGLYFNGQLVGGFQVKVKAKSTATTRLQFNVENAVPGVVEVRASYGGVTKSATLTIDPAAPLTLKSLSVPATGKRGKKIKAGIALTDLPLQPVQVPLELLDAAENPVLFLGVPVVYNLTMDRETLTANLKIPKELPAGTYKIRASYGGVVIVKTIVIS